MLQIFTEYVRASKYILVGLTGVLVDNIVLYLLYNEASIGLEISKVLSAETAIITNFLLNEKWTFKDAGKQDSIFKRFLKSNLIRLTGLAVSILVLVILYDYLGVWLLVANTIGIGAGFVFNYTLESLYTWKTQNPQ